MKIRKKRLVLKMARNVICYFEGSSRNLNKSRHGIIDKIVREEYWKNRFWLQECFLISSKCERGYSIVMAAHGT